jgi:hypothetical protein
MERVPGEVFDKAVQTLAEKVEQASSRLGREISVGGDEGVTVPELSLTPHKPNFARALVPVRVAGEHATNAWIIAFRPGDGTGDYSGFEPGSLLAPEDLLRMSAHGESALYPRPKTGMTAEICVPLAKAAFGHFYQGTSLQILRALRKNEEEGLELNTAEVHLRGASSFVTLGTDNFGRRAGDPHALVYPNPPSLVDTYERTALEVVAFLPSLNGEDYELDLLAAFDPVNPYTA